MAVSVGCLRGMRGLQHLYDDDDFYRSSLCGTSTQRARERLLHDLLTALHSRE